MADLGVANGVVDSTDGASATGVAMGELTHCLNCGGELRGPFCAVCGQRVVPPDPTVRELAGDAWNELTGYDGRIMATLRGLMRPGFLTHEYLSGRRARYLPPVRVYLIVSVIYFVIAASVPDDLATSQTGSVSGPGGMRIGVTDTGDRSEERRVGKEKGLMCESGYGTHEKAEARL